MLSSKESCKKFSGNIFKNCCCCKCGSPKLEIGSAEDGDCMCSVLGHPCSRFAGCRQTEKNVKNATNEILNTNSPFFDIVKEVKIIIFYLTSTSSR